MTVALCPFHEASDVLESSPSIRAVDGYVLGATRYEPAHRRHPKFVVINGLRDETSKPTTPACAGELTASETDEEEL